MDIICVAYATVDKSSNVNISIVQFLENIKRNLISLGLFELRRSKFNGLCFDEISEKLECLLWNHPNHNMLQLLMNQGHSAADSMKTTLAEKLQLKDRVGFPSNPLT